MELEMEMLKVCRYTMKHKKGHAVFEEFYSRRLRHK